MVLQTAPQHATQRIRQPPVRPEHGESTIDKIIQKVTHSLSVSCRCNNVIQAKMEATILGNKNLSH